MPFLAIINDQPSKIKCGFEFWVLNYFIYLLDDMWIYTCKLFVPVGVYMVRARAFPLCVFIIVLVSSFREIMSSSCSDVLLCTWVSSFIDCAFFLFCLAAPYFIPVVCYVFLICITKISKP